jgi:hypothetical protein
MNEPTKDAPEEITKRGVTFKIYFTPTVKGGQAYKGYTLVYYQAGQRKRELSSDYDALKARIDEVLEDVEDGHEDSVNLRRTQREEYLAADAFAQKAGLSLRVLASHAAQAVEILGGDLLIEAAREYKRRHGKVEPRPVADVVDEFLEAKKQAKRLRL